MWRRNQTASSMHRLLVAAAVAVSAGPVPGRAQQSNDNPPAYEPGETLKEVHDPVVAIVEGRNLYLSQLGDLVQQLPPGQRKLPFNLLYRPLLDNLIANTALELKARRLHLEEDPVVMRRMHAAAGRALEQALLDRIQEEKVTESALHALYDATYGGKTTVEQVHLRYILLGSETDAAKALGRLQAGEDFAAVARDVSLDPSSVHGGDLGYLRREQLRQDIAAVAFSLGPQKTTARPARINDGWCIIKVEDRVSVRPPSFDAVYDELRQTLARRTINEAAAAARAETSVQEFNMDGSPITDRGEGSLLYIPPTENN